MPKFQIQGKKKEKEEEKPKLTLVPLRNDRPLEEYELIAEQNAIELSIKGYKRIAPVPGTLGYLFRDLIGGNASVYEFAKNVLPDSNGRGKGATKVEVLSKQVILIWNALDDFSKNRVDVFDHLCDKVALKRSDFYGIAQKGMFEHFEAINQRILMETKTEVIHNVRQFARDEKNFRDRELAAKATGLTKDAPIIGTLDASTKVQNNLMLESNFSSSMKDLEKDIKQSEGFIEGEIVEKPKQLTEGNTEFLNTEALEDVKEEDLLAMLRK